MQQIEAVELSGSFYHTMTKRRAESASLPEVPQEEKKKKSRLSVRDAERVLAAPRARCGALTGEGRRKRPRSCEEPEQYERTGGPGSEPRDATHGTDHERCVSGKFRGASGACTCEMTSRESASESQVTRPDDNEDDLCAFNSFQFWRSPLPALDLSLLDGPPITEELEEDLSPKDPTEEMEA